MKAKQRAFYANMYGLLNNWGEVEYENDRLKTWELDTVIGKLHVTLFKNVDSRIYSVFTRFDNHREAAKTVNTAYAQVNEWSGKCNFHHKDPEVCKWLFLQAIEPILEPKTEPCEQY